MRTTTKAVRRWVFGAGMAAALGFGGAQAMAAPAPAAPREDVCDDVCNRFCKTFNPYGGGFCNDAGICFCLR
jgi:hypothetical protein